MTALNRVEATKVDDLIEDPPEEGPYESLKQSLTELPTLNPFQRYQALMALTLAVDEKPSTFPPPADVPALQKFLGMINFHRKFILGTALLLWPLTEALRGDPKDT